MQVGPEEAGTVEPLLHENLLIRDLGDAAGDARPTPTEILPAAFLGRLVEVVDPGEVSRAGAVRGAVALGEPGAVDAGAAPSERIVVPVSEGMGCVRMGGG